MIEVLLATYNGAPYLSEQLESLLSQEGVTLGIRVRDDGSSDDTIQILQGFAQRYSDRISILVSPGRLGSKGSFGWLLGQSSAPYVAFCDQDDVWANHKLRTLLTRMQTLERMHGKETPLLVHSDLEVVDGRLRPIAPSFWRYTGVDPSRLSLGQVLVKNPVTGCALMANRSLVEKAHPIPDEAVMHDHWLALVASAFGQVGVVNVPLVLYRQHSNNTVGAQEYGWRMIFKRLLSSCGRMDISRLRFQAGAFFARFTTQLSTEQGKLIDGFIHLPERGWFGRRLFLLRHGILMPGFIRNLALLLCIRMEK